MIPHTEISERKKALTLENIHVQSMTNTRTSDVSSSVDQVIALIEKGCSIIRLSTATIHDVECLEQIKREVISRGYKASFIADVHYKVEVAIKAAEIADKVRINPGNFLSKTELFLPISERNQCLRDKLKPLVDSCIRNRCSLRIGVNHGSVYKGIEPLDTAEKLVDSLMEYLEILLTLNFRDVVLSIKSSDPWMMLDANRLLKEEIDLKKWNFPIHLGVTEAGSGIEGRVKSATGIGLSLLNGIGNTIRVSLTEDPQEEIPVGNSIIAAVKTIDSEFQKLLIETKAQSHESLYLFKKPVLIHHLLSDEICTSSASWKGDLFYSSFEGVHHNKGQAIDFEDYITYPELVKRMEQNEVVNASFLSISIAEIVESIQLIYKENIDLPILVNMTFDWSDDVEISRLSIIITSLLRNQTISGVILESGNQEDFERQSEVMAEIFQISGMRNIKSSIISCPGCSRSTLKLEQITKELKVLDQRKKQTISVMGCAVNGYGEMMKSDFGIIGSSDGKADIYVDQKLALSAIKEEDIQGTIKDLLEKVT